MVTSVICASCNMNIACVSGVFDEDVKECPVCGRWYFKEQHRPSNYSETYLPKGCPSLFGGARAYPGYKEQFESLTSGLEHSFTVGRLAHKIVTSKISRFVCARVCWDCADPIIKEVVADITKRGKSS